MTARIAGAPGTVAVDLTPLLPGGDNGGAKTFALQLVRSLAAIAPHTAFILLTQHASHDELAALESANVRRERVIGPATSAGRNRLFAMASRWMPYLPRPMQRFAGSLGYRVNAVMKRHGARGLLRRIGADALLCPFTAPTYREPGVPTVCTLYDLQFRAYPQFFAVEDAMQRASAFDEACRGAAALAAISEFSRKEALAASRLDPARISTVYLRLGVAEAQGEGRVFDRLALKRGAYLIYPANLWRHKNHELLLAAFSLARRQGLDTDIKLVLTGAGGEREAWIRDAAAAMGIGDAVVFAGFVPGADLSALVAHAKALVFPSLYEGFGLPVVEAMAHGVPVACSDIAALPEIAGGAALLFDPRVPASVAAAIVAVANDTTLRERLIAAGRERARAFADSHMMAREYWELLVDAARQESRP